MVTFHPNCTLPQQTPVFVTATNVRSTLDIAFSCVSILILCSWSILHLNLPRQYDRNITPTNSQKWLRKGDRLLQKIKWMIITLIAPEILFARAVAVLRSARHHSKLFRDFATKDEVPWSTTHTIFADMGGFVIEFCSPTHLETESLPHSNEALQSSLNSGANPLDAAAEPPGPGESARSPETELQPITSQLYEARKRNIIAALPHITEDELWDNSKGDSVVKVLALIQVIWMIVQVATRAALNKSTSPLEVMIIAFSVCALVIYLLMLDHPQDVNTSVNIAANRAAQLEDVQAIALSAPLSTSLTQTELGRVSNAAVYCLWPEKNLL
ncbi:hypothetical protein ACHAQH_006075 [Verticillium albo-atrum]